MRAGAIVVAGALGLAALTPAAIASPTAVPALPEAGYTWTPQVIPDRVPAPRPAGPQVSARPGAPSSAPRTPAAGQSSDYVDRCQDATGTAVDARRLAIGMVGDDTLELSVRACAGHDLTTLATRTLVWQAVTTRPPRSERRVEVTDLNEDGTLEVIVYDIGPGGIATPVPTSTSAGVRQPGPTTPVHELWVQLPREALVPRSRCDPTGATPCAAVRFASIGKDGSVGDTVPDAGMPTPGWPSRCRPALAPHDAAHVLITTRTGQATTVADRLTSAGYRAAVLSHDMVEVPVGATPEVTRALRAWDEVTAVVPAPVRQPAAVTPSDPLFPDQWALPRVGFPQAWEVTTGSDQVTIAVLDDGIDGTRSDLAGRVVAGYDAVSRTVIPAGADSDLGAHGTAVAGIAAATGNDGAGLAGADWRADVLPIRVADHEGCIDVEPYLHALDWATDAARDGRIDVTNISLGGRPLDTEAARIRDLVGAGSVIVAATGNEANHDGSRPFHPAALPDVIAVGATGPDDEVASYSNRGRYVDVVAPGGTEGGTSTTGVLALADPTRDGSPHTALAGTSFATPLVSGIASLYLAARPAATPADVTRALLGTAGDLGTGLAGFDPAYGFGLAAAGGALAHEPGQTQLRLGGSNRYETAAVAARRAFPEPTLVDTVLLATGSDYPDALAGGPLAARMHAPVLLTVRDHLPQATVEALDRLAPRRVLLLGGTAVIDDAVATEVASRGVEVTRIDGATRYETAARIAVGRLTDADPPATWGAWSASDVVYVATGEAFADALAGGAAAAAQDAPLLLTPSTTLSPVTAAALDRLSPSVVVILGGDRAVAPAVADAIAAGRSRPTVIRAAGSDRYATAVAAGCPAPDTHPTLCEVDTRYAVVATGTTFADALGGSATAAALRAPLLLVPGTGTLPALVTSGLARLEAEQVVVLGGPVAIHPEIADQAAALAVR